MSEQSNSYTRTALINAGVLGVFAAVVALLLGLVYVSTKDQIAESRKAAEEKALLEVIGDFSYDNDLITDVIGLSELDQTQLNTNATNLYVIRTNNEVSGFIFPTTAPDGYSGNIDILVGVKIDGEVLGVRVVEHKETPGLGDKVDTNKSDWIYSFTGKSLSNPNPKQWAVKKEGGVFDAFTGATITPRAVVNRVQSTLNFIQSNREKLLQRAEPAKEETGEPQATNEALAANESEAN